MPRIRDAFGGCQGRWATFLEMLGYVVREVTPVREGRHPTPLETFNPKVRDALEDRRTSIPGIDIRPSQGWIYVYPRDGRTSNFFDSHEVRKEG